MPSMTICQILSAQLLKLAPGDCKALAPCAHYALWQEHLVFEDVSQRDTLVYAESSSLLLHAACIILSQQVKAPSITLYIPACLHINRI